MILKGTVDSLSLSLSPMLSSHVNLLGLIVDTLTLHVVLLCHIHRHNSAIRSVRRLQGHQATSTVRVARYPANRQKEAGLRGGVG